MKYSLPKNTVFLLKNILTNFRDCQKSLLMEKYMLMKVIKNCSDTISPDMAEVETALKIGDKFKMEYDWCDKKPSICGEIQSWHKDVGEFTVVDIVCNMIIKPSEVWVRLAANDEKFTKRCGSKEFDAPEEQILERLVA